MAGAVKITERRPYQFGIEPSGDRRKEIYDLAQQFYGTGVILAGGECGNQQDSLRNDLRRKIKATEMSQSLPPDPYFVIANPDQRIVPAFPGITRAYRQGGVECQRVNGQD